MEMPQEEVRCSVTALILMIDTLSFSFLEHIHVSYDHSLGNYSSNLLTWWLRGKMSSLTVHVVGSIPRLMSILVF